MPVIEGITSDPFEGHDGDIGRWQPTAAAYSLCRQEAADGTKWWEGARAGSRASRGGEAIDYHPLEKLQYRQVPAFRISSYQAQGTGEPEGVQTLASNSFIRKPSD